MDKLGSNLDMSGKQSRPEEERWAHNPEVGGSKPPFATLLPAPGGPGTVFCHQGPLHRQA